MKTIQTNTLPSYSAIQVFGRMNWNLNKPIHGRFRIMEYQDGRFDQICEIGYRDCLQQMMLRGIPHHNALVCMYEMETLLKQYPKEQPKPKRIPVQTNCH